MVRITSSILGAAVVLSGLSRAAPAANKRQDITPIVAAPGGDAAGIPIAGGSADPSLNSIDLSGVNTDIPGESVSVGNSVEFPTDTSSSIDVTSTSIEYTSTSVDYTSSSVDATSTSTYASTSTPVVIPPVSSGNGYNYPIYGSGTPTWQVNYNSCVQTCFAQYPPPPTTVTLPPSDQAPIGDGSVSSGSSVSPAASGSGNVWNIAVAPVKGVFRFVPPFVNAQVGDTIRYTWVNGPHTVTKSSGATPCNASIGGFQSGKQNAGFSFDQTVNDTKPIWFYCGVATHCENGMFGGVNVPNGDVDSKTTVAALMPQWAASNPDIASAWNATSVAAATTPGMTWGDKIDLASVPADLHPGIAKSILYTRAVIAENKDMVGADGVFRPQSALKFPADFSALLADADSGSPSGAQNIAAGPTGAVSSSASDAVPTPSQAPETNGAGSIVSSRAAVAAAALAAVFFML